MNTLKLGIIGCGNMGRVIAKALAEAKLLPLDAISLYDIKQEQAQILSKEAGKALKDLKELVSSSDLILIAVKPQDSDKLLDELKGQCSGKTVISIMAGVTISTIDIKIGQDVAIVRAMPNLAASVGEGITAISCNDKVTKRPQVKEILGTIGKVIEVSEEQMDIVTALSGSGPAYLFYLAEAMIEAGKEEGLDEEVCTELVEQTLYGASLYLKDSGEKPHQLIMKVASKGGTTEAALLEFDEKKKKDIIKSAIHKAKERSSELSRG